MRVDGRDYRSVWLEGSVVRMVDQRQLPWRFTILDCPAVEDTAAAIEQMATRGAGAIGVAAGFGVAQAALLAPDDGWREVLGRAAGRLRATRPTAHDLFYAVERVADAAVRGRAFREAAVAEAQRLADANAAAGLAIGEAGAALIREGTRVLTHCNTGWLAFADWGSALAPVYVAHQAGRRIHVWVDETRPRSQGAKLTAWELAQEGVPHTVVVDGAAGELMRRDQVDIVVVGADRVTAGGDVANKIGTYALAVLARHHQIPFYVAAPCSTVDHTMRSGDEIVIEQRSPDEVLWVTGCTEQGQVQRVRIAPGGSPAANPAFDITPAALITGLITERGMVQATPEGVRSLQRVRSAVQ